MIDLLAPLFTNTLKDMVFLKFLVSFALKIVAKIMGTGDVSFEIFLLFLRWPTGLGNLGKLVTKN